MRRWRMALGAILLLSLALRLAWGLRQPMGDSALAALPDQVEYLAVGRNLLAGRGLQFTDPRFDEQVWAYRTPGYPLLIAACGGNIRGVRIVQAVLDTSTVLAVFLLARWWLSPGLALLAAAIVGVNPFLIYFSGLVLSETLFTCLLAWGLVLIVRSGGPWPEGRAAKIGWLGGGLLLAFAALVRPSATALPVVAAVAGAFVNKDLLPNPAGAQTYRWRRPLPIGLTFLGLTALVLFPWAARNKARLGEWVWTSTNGGVTRYDGFNRDATGASDQSFILLLPELRQMGELGRAKYLGDRADEFIREHPSRAAKLAVLKVARTWSPVPLSRQFGSNRLYVAAGLLYSVPLLLLSAVGAFSPGLSRSAKALLLAPAAYFTLIHAASVGSLRYRIPVEPPMAVIAAVGCSRIVPVWRSPMRNETTRD